MGAWFVYILECADYTLYTGITIDLERRLDAHRQGTASRYTRSRLPVELVYAETQPDRAAALQREAAIKKLDRSAKQRLVASTSAGARRSSPSSGSRCRSDSEKP
jgi:predicted GIY-YIG superfamily endonuclease